MAEIAAGGKSGKVVIKNIGLLLSGDIDKPILDADTIVVNDGLIAAVGKEKDCDLEGAQTVIDARKTCVAPGLIDSHVHPVFGDWTPRQGQIGWIDSTMHGGVTTMISAGEVHLPGRPKDIVGLKNADVLIGDSASLRGDASGGATDRLAGADGNDLVVGDSYAPYGNASGSGNDKSTPVNHKGGLNGGPGNDVLVGDNYTKTGTTSGGGSDALQSGDGGDENATCKPGTCDDVFYGDNYSASCGDKRTVPAIDCQIGDTSGGGPDLLTTDQGNDLLVGGTPNNPELRGDGDKCKGGSGHDVAALCEFVYKDVESRLHVP